MLAASVFFAIFVVDDAKVAENNPKLAAWFAEWDPVTQFVMKVVGGFLSISVCGCGAVFILSILGVITDPPVFGQSSNWPWQR
jgi:hypothetical protein